MKKVVYTAVTGCYDDLRSVVNPCSSIDYVCFTDYAFSGCIPKPWIHVRLPPTDLSNKSLARFCKLNPDYLLPGYEESLWIDGNIGVTGNLIELFNSLKPYKVAAYDHWWRDKTEQEFFACARHGFDWAWQLKSQSRRYYLDGYTSDNFYENNVVYRKHMLSDVISMHRIWWNEYVQAGKRDQYSFTYSAFKVGIKIHSLGLHDPRLVGNYFSYHAHSTSNRGILNIVRKVVNRSYIIASRWSVDSPIRTNSLKDKHKGFK
ncbi:hypothetical protein IS519_09410 [Vibrio crassostreae]|uniref:hypothetical protein n=1 Tax=Vibrio crassostreae TaxID=246167 RepID=UPI00200ADFD1|nr:hypothetical protein [Vibrio crassostreae]UPR28433.1 hypothetical protein IS519_09410 [Vibrio crassostreae]